MILYLLPLFALAMIIVPLVIAIRKVHAGVKFNRKKSILLNCGMFLGTMILMPVFMPVLASAEGAGAAAVPPSSRNVGRGVCSGLCPSVSCMARMILRPAVRRKRRTRRGGQTPTFLLFRK